MSRLVVWSPNYAPELTGIPPLVTDACEWLCARGHDVDVITTMPSYPERRIRPEYRGRFHVREERNGIRVNRWWLYSRPEERLVDKGLYELSVATIPLPWAVPMLRRADAVLCVIPTLLAGVFVTTFSRAPVVLWVQDLVLSASESIEMSSVARGVVRGFHMVERRALSRAKSVVVCSPGFRDEFAAIGIDPAKITVAYNWADLEGIVHRRPETRAQPRFLYAGNIGYTQGLDTLVDAARLLGESIHVSIVGDGNAAAGLVDSIASSSAANVTYSPPVARERFSELLAEHDVHIVVQRRVAAGANLPSKIASYLASGRPVIASIDGDTPAAELLRESGAAVIVQPESSEALAQAMCQLRDDPALRIEMGRRARVFAEGRLAKEPSMLEIERALLGS